MVHTTSPPEAKGRVLWSPMATCHERTNVLHYMAWANWSWYAHQINSVHLAKHPQINYRLTIDITPDNFSNSRLVYYSHCDCKQPDPHWKEPKIQPHFTLMLDNLFNAIAYYSSFSFSHLVTLSLDTLPGMGKPLSKSPFCSTPHIQTDFTLLVSFRIQSVLSDFQCPPLFDITGLFSSPTFPSVVLAKLANFSSITHDLLTFPSQITFHGHCMNLWIFNFWPHLEVCHYPPNKVCACDAQ